MVFTDYIRGVGISDNCQASCEIYIEWWLRKALWTGFVVLEALTIVACQISTIV